jgi:protein involved in polysaccharide export with SLBB domain
MVVSQFRPIGSVSVPLIGDVMRAGSTPTPPGQRATNIELFPGIELQIVDPDG